MGGDWRASTIGEIAAPVRNALVGGPFGSNLVSRDYVDAGVPVIRGQNMGGRWVGGEFAYVTEAKAKSLEANIARPGDIVFTQRGTLGQVSVVPTASFDRYLVSQSQMKLTVNQDLADPLFIYYFFSTEEQQDYIRQNAIQTGVPHTNLGILRGTPVPLPPLSEQRAIARILGTLDDKIELNRRMNETLEAIARALFKSWFVDFDPVRAKADGRDPGLPKHVADLFPDSFEDFELGEIPRGWDVKTIGELAEVVGGSTPKTDRADFWENGIHHWVTPKDLSSSSVPVLLDTERKITDAGLSQISSGLLPTGTVLLSSRAPIGYLAIAEIPVAINQGFIGMRPKPGTSNLFLLRWAEACQTQIVSRANGSTFLEISKASFRPIPVVVPDSALIAAFDRLLRPIYLKVVEQARETRTLITLRESLLPKLVSGAVRVKGAGRAREETESK
ncbi:MAG TPA: restriction endonuclease subunit S [Steroidobacteraceae bacterium]|nr:restriction endonuclease subunit S [Steroidobacteraceae bacterium]